MIGLPKPPVSQSLSKAKIQDISKYGDYVERLNLTLKQDRFSLFSRATFDRKTKSEIRRKRGIPFLIITFWISVISSIILLILGFAVKDISSLNISWVLVLIVLGGLIVGTWFYSNILKHKPESHLSSGLLEETPDLERAKTVQDWAQHIIDSQKQLFILDIASGQIYKFSDVLSGARNNILGLLGDIYHRKALGIAGHIGEGPIIYLKSEEQDIFGDLEEKLFPKPIEPEPKLDSEAKAQSELEPKPELETEPEPVLEPVAELIPEPEPELEPELELKNQSGNKTEEKPIDISKMKANPVTEKPDIKLSPAKLKFREEEEARIESAKKRGTFYEKSKPKAHDNKHLQAIQTNKAMLKLINDYTKNPDFWKFVVKDNNGRRRWADLIPFLYKNWDELQVYLTLPNENRKFVETIFGPQMLNFKPLSKARKDFRNGRHRELSDFIRLCYEIPVDQLPPDQLPPDEQIDIFEDEKLIN